MNDSFTICVLECSHRIGPSRRRVFISSQATSTGRMAFCFPLGVVYDTHTSNVCASATRYSITSSVLLSRLPLTSFLFFHSRSPFAARYRALSAAGSSIRCRTYRPTVLQLGTLSQPRAAPCCCNASYSISTVQPLSAKSRSNQMFWMMAFCSSVRLGNVAFSRGFRHSASARK